MRAFSKTVRYKAGEVIFSEGDPAECAYIIDHGEVEVLLERQGVETPLGIIRGGEIFGEMAIIDGRRRSATARACSDCQLTVVSQSQVQERVNQADSIVRLLLMILLKRIRSANGSLDRGELSLRPTDTASEAPVKLKLTEPSSVIDKIKFESELLDALNNKNFVLHYQPIVNFHDGSLAGAEALIRWESPRRGMVRPDLFMGIAEETSLIVPIGRWVIGQAMADLMEINKKLGLAKNFFMSINISGRQFQDPGFFQDLEQAVFRHQINKENIRLEITEGVLLEGPLAAGHIQRLRDLGFRISLDDFGTGYSSLSYLSDLQFDSLKIDRSFVKNMQKDPKALILCRSITNIANDLGLKVVAEGVETTEQSASLTALGCAYGQGFLFGKPMSLDSFVKAFKKSAVA
jgi:EAL domain-containing protein (putative c-di-GMP-specific phosphodiesterase class I)